VVGKKSVESPLRPRIDPGGGASATKPKKFAVAVVKSV
jgi:hypothetical protein